MLPFVENWAGATWDMLVDSAFLLIVGLTLAGLLHVFLNEKNIGRLLGHGRKSDVIRAALLGVPLPLCSCSVLPVAKELHRSGVSRGATVSFLISTPESGVDSIMLTYSLTDPILTVARPLTAFLSATVAGFWEKASGQPELPVIAEPVEAMGCCCSSSPAEPPAQSLIARLGGGIKYAFTDLLSDLASYLLFGYLVAGLVAVVLGTDMLVLPESLMAGWGGYLGAIIIGVPLYICATSSTPLAAALLAIGFSPGAVLVFLMVGPATNLASLTVVAQMLKGWSMVRYLTSIVVVAIVCGIAADYIYSWFDLSNMYRVATMEHGDAFYNSAAATFLLLLIVLYSLKRILWRRV